MDAVAIVQFLESTQVLVQNLVQIRGESKVVCTLRASMRLHAGHLWSIHDTCFCGDLV